MISIAGENSKKNNYDPDLPNKINQKVEEQARQEALEKKIKSEVEGAIPAQKVDKTENLEKAIRKQKKHEGYFAEMWHQWIPVYGLFKAMYHLVRYEPNAMDDGLIKPPIWLIYQSAITTIFASGLYKLFHK